MHPTTLVWFRDDLRIADNPALHHASQQGQVIGVYLVSENQWEAHHVGSRRRSFVRESLRALGERLAALNIPLLSIPTPTFDDAPATLLRVAGQLGARRLAFNEQLPLNERRRDAAVRQALEPNGIAVEVHQAGTLAPVGQILTNDGNPYSVYSAFKRRWLDRAHSAWWTPLPLPDTQAVVKLPQSLRSSVVHEPVAGICGEARAQRLLDDFVKRRAAQYDTQRDMPSADGTSRLSEHLSCGTLSARQCLAAVLQNDDKTVRLMDGRRPGADSWVGELVWRDFYRHIVALIPRISRGCAFRQDTDSLAWRNNEAELAAWQAGRTGYPLVDAGMRQLERTGWMHNRLRMVTAMFLTKHLLMDWRLGEQHFMSQLVDGDFAANNGGWQWSASTGTDAAPYFRIFNPITQATRFDPRATFIKRFVPELEGLSAKQIHANPSRYAHDYPAPMVDHRMARQRALDAFKRLRG